MHTKYFFHIKLNFKCLLIYKYYNAYPFFGLMSMSSRPKLVKCFNFFSKISEMPI